MKNKLNVKFQISENKFIEINDKNTEITYFSKGNGGQNLNKHEKGVRLKYTIKNNGEIKSIIAKCIDQRSLEQNFKKAIKQLIKKIRKHFYKKPDRKESKIPNKAKLKRLNDKKINSQKKEDRKKPNILN